jgi:hypothetical protein
MQIKKYSGRKIFISREYKNFAFFATISICLAYGLFCFISYKNHQEAYNQRSLSLGFSVANNYEVFLNNIFMQAEFVGHKIENTQNINRDKALRYLLRRHFSVGVDLNTSLLSSWVLFEWEKNHDTKSYSKTREEQNPWKLHFDSLHSTGVDIKDSYLPISFGVTNKDGDFIGKLISKINMGDVIQYLQHNIKDGYINILILDKENNIIAQSTADAIIPRNFFKNHKFPNDSDNLRGKDNSFDDKTYLAYKKVNSYPFTIVIGENKKTIFQPLINIFIKYLCVLAAVLFSFLTILLLFYKRIITPITSLSSFADKIIHSENAINYTPEKHSFIEIKNLAAGLIKIETYKKQICHSNKKLNEKTIELAATKENLERELDKLSNSYILRDNFNKEIVEKRVESTTSSIKKCLDMLYPEIYSRQLKIVESLSADINLEINCNKFTKVISGLLTRSFIFSTKNNPIEITTNIARVNNIDYFCVTIVDRGLGDEDWRRQNLKNNSMAEIVDLVEKNNGILHCLDQAVGVKYCLLLPHKKLKCENQTNNIIRLFPNK